MPSFGGVGREAITFVLSGDASGLIKSFGDVEKAADKSLGNTEDKITKLSATMTKIGAVSMATGLSTALGLVQFIKDAEKAEEATNKFETAIKGMHSSIDTGAIKKLAFDLQQVSTVTDDQVVAAARWGAVYGLTTKQLEQLLMAPVDLAAQTGKSLDVVTKSLAKAATGGATKPLEKLGLQFDATAMKADAFAATMEASTAFAGGAAAKRVDTFSGQLQRLGNNWDDVKEQIGAGANEVFEPLATGAADLSEQLAKANPELLKTVGHFTAIGSLAMTGFGGLATVAGQFVNIKEAVDGLGLKLKNAEGGLTGLGKAAAGLGAAAVGIAAVDAAFAAINAGKGYAEQAADAIDRMSVAIDKGKDKDAFKAFKDAVKAQQDTARLSGLWEQFGAKIEYEMDKAGTATVEGTADIENMQRALDSLSPGQAKVALDQLARFTATLDHSSDQYKTNMEWIDKNRKAVDAHAKAATAAAAAANGLTVKQQEQVDIQKEVVDSLKGSNGAMALFERSAAQAAAGVKGFNDAIEGMDTDERLKGATDLGDAFHKVSETIKDLPPSFDEVSASLGGYNEEQTKAIAAVTDWGDATKAQIDALIQTGASTDEVTLKSAAYITKLRDVMTQAGLTDEQVDAYLTTLGLTPEDIKTAVKLSGDAEAKFRLGLLSNAISGFNADERNAIQMRIAMGDYQGALYGTLVAMQRTANKNPVTVPVTVEVATQNVMKNVRWAVGGGKSAPAPSAAVPLTAVPMAAAPSSPAPITINVQTGIGDPAEIGRKVIDAIRHAERVQGMGWRSN